MKRLIVLTVLIAGCSANPARFDAQPPAEEVTEEAAQPSPEEVAAERLKTKTESLKVRKKEEATAMLDTVPAVDPQAQELRTRINQLITDIDRIAPKTEEELLTEEFQLEQRMTELRTDIANRKAAARPATGMPDDSGMGDAPTTDDSYGY